MLAYPEGFFTEVNFAGTPGGLNAEHGLIPVSEPKTFDHGQGIVTTVWAQYADSTEFVSFFSETNPSKDLKELKVTTDYVINPDTGLLTATTTRTTDEQSPAKVSVCHYQRTN